MLALAVNQPANMSRGAGSPHGEKSSCFIFPPFSNVTHALVDVQLEFLLRNALLDPLAEGGVAGRAAAALAVLDQAAALAVEGRRGRPVVAVLLGTETIHPGGGATPCGIRQQNKCNTHHKIPSESPESVEITSGLGLRCPPQVLRI